MTTVVEKEIVTGQEVVESMIDEIFDSAKYEIPRGL